jgi:hypothetical protein
MAGWLGSLVICHLAKLVRQLRMPLDSPGGGSFQAYHGRDGEERASTSFDSSEVCAKLEG